MDGFPSVTFVVDTARSRDAQLFFAYLERADSYTNCSLLYLHSKVYS